MRALESTTSHSSACRICTCRRFSRRDAAARTATTSSIPRASIPSSAPSAICARSRSALHERDMGLILDIVPNHMGIGAENPYWDDVLAHGERSRFARWFDIAWTSSDGGRGKIVLPVLGDELERVLARGELSVELREGATPRIVVSLAQLSRSIPTSLPPDLQLAQVDPEETGELAQLYSGVEGQDRLRALLARSALSSRRLASRLDGDQLPPLLRRERSRGAARRGSGRVRRDARAHAAPRATTASSTGCASTTSTVCSIRRPISIGCAPRRRLGTPIFVEKILVARRTALAALAGAGHDGLRVPQRPRGRVSRAEWRRGDRDVLSAIAPPRDARRSPTSRARAKRVCSTARFAPTSIGLRACCQRSRAPIGSVGRRRI